MTPADINGGDDDILGPMIGPGVPPTPAPVAAHTDGQPGPQVATDDDILGALAPEAAATETGQTGVLSAQAEQRIREQVAAAATAATAAAAAAGVLLSSGRATVRAAIPRAGAAVHAMRDAGIRHWRMLALAGAGCVLALGAFAFGPGLVRAWNSHRARPPQTAATPIPHAVTQTSRPSNHPSTPERAVVARAPVRPPLPAVIPAPAPAAPPRPVIQIAAVPHQSAVTVQPRLPVPARPHPVRSSTAAQKQAAKALAAEERFFRHQGGGG